jgi:hypothetical protein
MVKLSPKNKNQLVVRMVILSDLMLSTLDELQVHAEAPMVVDTKRLISYLEQNVDQGYKNEIAKKTNKLTDLIHKVNTVIRKNNQ